VNCKEFNKHLDVVMGTRFCTACRTTQPVEGGVQRRTANGATRWICQRCRDFYRAREGK
jgi:hypothetical protein